MLSFSTSAVLVFGVMCQYSTLIKEKEIEYCYKKMYSLFFFDKCIHTFVSNSQSIWSDMTCKFGLILFFSTLLVPWFGKLLKFCVFLYQLSKSFKVKRFVGEFFPSFLFFCLWEFD